MSTAGTVRRLEKVDPTGGESHVRTAHLHPRSKVRPGKLETYQAHLAEATDMVESEEPRMIAFNSYASEDGTDVSTVQVHPDSESLELHLKLFAERLSARVFEAVDSYEIDIYGRPSDAVLEFLGQMSSSWARCRAEGPARSCGCGRCIRAGSYAHSRCDLPDLSVRAALPAD